MLHKLSHEPQDGLELMLIVIPNTIAFNSSKFHAPELDSTNASLSSKAEEV
jgi:hypothetical protein